MGISRNFSRYTTPSKYYVAFPHGVYSPKWLQPLRPLISSKNNFYLASPEGKTAKDGEYLAFTFDSNDFAKYKAVFKSEEKLQWKSGVWVNDHFEGEKFGLSKRYTGRFITLQQVLESANVTPENTHKMNWYYNIDSWEKYCIFLGSPERKYVNRPRFGFSYREFNPLATDNVNAADHDANDVDGD